MHHCTVWLPNFAIHQVLDSNLVFDFTNAIIMSVYNLILYVLKGKKTSGR